MSRRRATIDLAGVMATIARKDYDDLDTSLLDAAETLLRQRGLRKWSLDDVADAARAGRTTVYRRFGSRDDLVHAVLARELRNTVAAIAQAAAGLAEVEDKAVAGVTTALRLLEGSVVDALLRSDPDTFLPILTTDAGPLLTIATTAINDSLRHITGQTSPALAEAAARVGLSFVLTRTTVLPVENPQHLDAAVRQMVRAVLLYTVT